ncbi:MAG: hypothetical protein PHG91_05805 [Syntrophales bacterium]|nr:hypothetical protein [Syntrophales bacterium]MDD5532541.1 hypothetical protein [Syntrophales bacterium]
MIAIQHFDNADKVGILLGDKHNLFRAGTRTQRLGIGKPEELINPVRALIRGH